MTLLQALLCGLVAVYGVFDYALGSLYLNRPIFLSAITGLILGDFKTGIIVGAILEMFFMGFMSIGAYIPPDLIIGSILMTALVIINNYSVGVSVLLAMPVAIFSNVVDGLIAFTQPFFLKQVDYYVDKGNAHSATIAQWSIAIIDCGRRLILTVISCVFYLPLVKIIMSLIPIQIIEGINIAGGLMPAIGLAMLMRNILTKQILPYYFLGFALMAYLKIPLSGIVILSIIMVFIKYELLNQKARPEEEKESSSGGIDDDF